MNGRNWGVWLLAGLLASCGGTKPSPAVTPATATDVMRAVHDPSAKVVLVNMWASWCGPCREEFPDLLRLQRAYAARGLKVVFVSWDDTAAEAAKFLAQQGVASPSFIKTSSQRDQDFLNDLEPRLTGALPTTLVYDATGRLRSFWEGAANYAEMEQKVMAVLKDQKPAEK